MLNEPTLLVVDDEDVICEGCRRIFSRQGFQVEKSSDAVEGLTMAAAKDYAVILLDIKMPKMDGIEFLEALRGKKPGVPVILITGYPSIPNAAAAVRLGASDYVTKPFTPEKITEAVRRALAGPTNEETARPLADEPAAEQWGPAAEEHRFWDESWFQLGRDGSVRVGASLSRSDGTNVEAVRLPQVGEMVYQGLPLAGLIVHGKVERTIPSPISGVVVEVNPLLQECLPALWNDSCWSGWIACIAPSRLEEESEKCRVRRLILANADQLSALEQSDHLKYLGCQVRVVSSWEELAPALPDPGRDVLIVDEASFGPDGLEVVARVNEEAPSVKVVVVASSASRWEAAYREQKLFYYAVQPFADNEIDEVLNAAFRGPPRPFPHRKRRTILPQTVSSIYITNHSGKQVCLLAEDGLLRRDDGLGWLVRNRLLDQCYPMETLLGSESINRVKIADLADTCDHLLVLLAKDTGRLSGSLVQDNKGEFVPVTEESAGKVTALVVQPDSPGSGLAGFDERTTVALADRLVTEMTAS
jgi:DNA-binding response OmpR family regulator